MQKIIISFIAILGIWLPQLSPAQGTIYLSNMGQPQTSNGVVASDSWIAQRFQTGPDLNGYTLNSVQLLMAQASGGASGFSATLYTSVNGLPGTMLAGFSGLDPSMPGIYTYAASSISLSPSTAYYVVFTAATPMAQGSYHWNRASSASYIASDGWSLAPFSVGSADGSDWLVYRLSLHQFAVDATAVPEPATTALMSLGLAALSFWRCRK